MEPNEEAERRDELPELLEELIELVERAKSMPLSSSAIISRDEVLGLLVAAPRRPAESSSSGA